MSNKLSGRVWELDLDHAESHVLLALADNAHDDGTHCYPSVPFIAWKSGYSERQVQRILRALEEQKIIHTYRKKVRGGTFQYFTLHLENAKEKPPFQRGDILSDIFPSGGDILSNERDKMSEDGDVLSKEDVIMSPKPLVESQEKPLEEERDTRASRAAASGVPSPPPPMPLSETEGFRRAREQSDRNRADLKSGRMKASVR